ncbi:RNA-directed DNA polymerase [Kerstersia gyiorum]|uniref:Reverse transcriptase n=1 Tax=Kerstersia gyiorum TaxID=206506 RepID=A0A171KSE0_9BURK|nr:RNA-directed DNA polymerase [Kerstersia gyiorum]KKO71807.1 reverse transcriptase [Kerstersia gyiorum]
MDTGYSFELLVQAYFDCRRHKRNTASALRFEQNLERNLLVLHDDLTTGAYHPGRSICFAITRPRPREVWAADFRDRIVHHLLYNQIAERFHRRFIADSCACIPGRGTLYAAQRLEAKIRSQTQNWSIPGWYCKMDLANFFVSIDKRILWPMMAEHIPERWWRMLAKLLLFHDPRLDYELRGDPGALSAVPAHKRLMNAGLWCGLPIGNLNSQFGANVLLNALDQHAKHVIGARHYIRYVDDFVLLHESPQWLNDARASIEAFLPGLGLALNPRKTIIQPIARGVDLAGHVIKPWRREVRRRTIHSALTAIEAKPEGETLETINSYLGLLRHADGYQDRSTIARAARKRGHSVTWNATKAYQKGKQNVVQKPENLPPQRRLESTH